MEALDAVPTIGPTIATHVAELAHRGGLTLLDRLEGAISPARLLSMIGRLGPKLARRFHRDLGVESLEDLERAVHDGRLARVAGFGPRRVRAVRDQLASILGRSARHRARRRAWLEARDGAQVAEPRPTVATLLAADTEYRDRAALGSLLRVAPRRFNPARETWLPILHTEREGWQITALFSNTARANELRRTHDWVELFYERAGDSGQCTVVTEHRGELAGRRVVPGRESECGPPAVLCAAPIGASGVMHGAGLRSSAADTKRSLDRRNRIDVETRRGIGRTTPSRGQK